jgi:carboxymethylenebutenolidase
MSTRDDVPSDIIGLVKTAPVSRRGFMSASAAATAGYTLAAGPVRAQAIKTDTTGIGIKEDVVKVAAGNMPVYSAWNTSSRSPGIVLVAMEVFGLHEYVKDVVRRLAQRGFHAVAPDYYFTKGDLTKITDMAQLMPLVNSKPDAELVAELEATVDWAAKGKFTQPDPQDVGIIGFCRGGRAVWVYCANSTRVRAGVAFYGSLVDPEAQKAVWPKSPMELAPQMKAPVLGLYGEADQGIPVTQVEAMKAALQAAGKTAEFKIYSGAPHGFHADYRPSYRKETAEDAWQQAMAWFDKQGVKG